jgi:hypothetical protein
MKKKVLLKVIIGLYLISTLSFGSCELFDCVKCTRDQVTDWGCGDHEREQLESQGYSCDY